MFLIRLLPIYYKKNVIPQVRTYTRYGTRSVVMFDYAESPFGTHGRFRINEITRLVPTPVLSVLWNDRKNRIE